MRGGPVSGRRVTFLGDAMASIVQGVIEVRTLIGHPPVIVGGLAVLSRLSNPYRATVDLYVVDRLLGDVPQLEVLRAAAGAESVEPAAVVLATRYGAVKVDVLEVRQVELDHPSDDPGDRLHASAHAWANDTATDLTIEVVRSDGGPKQGSDLLDILRLTFDEATRPVALTQIGSVHAAVANDIALHVDLWFVRRRQQALQWIRRVGGDDVTTDDLDLVGELLSTAASR